MKEIHGNIWSFYAKDLNNVVCVTTNGIIKKSGAAVMGRGIAKQVADRFPEFPFLLADFIHKYGNVVNYWSNNELRLVSFPTKHNWRNPSDIKLIEQSARELARIAEGNDECTFYLPRPGCSNGGLIWEDVREIIAPILPNNVIAITY